MAPARAAESAAVLSWLRATAIIDVSTESGGEADEDRQHQAEHDRRDPSPVSARPGQAHDAWSTDLFWKGDRIGHL